MKARKTQQFDLAADASTGWIASRGYDANSGFYWTTNQPLATGSEIFIDFPEDITKRLRHYTRMTVNWKARLKFLFKPQEND